MNFIKKLAPVITSALLLGMTTGVAAAMNLADYPSPFVAGGKADVGIVLGTSSLATPDILAAVDIATNLQAHLSGVSGGSGSVTTGEGVNLATSNTKLYYGSALNAARTTLTKSELPTVLADGKVLDDNGNEYSFTQSIDIGNSTIEFSNSGADIADPVLLINVGTTATDQIYKYALTFNKELNVSSPDVQGNNIKIMGQDFTIGASSTSSILYLYGVGTGVSLKEGENKTVTVGGVDYAVSCDGVSSTTIAMVTVNGVSKEITEGNIYKFGDLEVYAKNVFYLSKEAQVSSVELSLGSKRLKISNAATVKQGSDDTTIKNTYATVTAGASTNHISAVSVFQASENTKTDHLGIGGDFTDRVFGTTKVSFKEVIPSLDNAGRDKIVVDTDNSRNVRATFTDALTGKEHTFNFVHDSDTGESTVTQRFADSSNYTISGIEGLNISENEYVIVNSGDYGRILEFSSSMTGEISSTDYITFTDTLSNEEFKVYVGQNKGRASNNTMNIDGQTYYVTLWNSTGRAKVTWGSGATYDSVGDYKSIFPRIKLKNGEWIIFAYNPATREQGLSDMNSRNANFTNGTVIRLPGEYAKLEDVSSVTLPANSSAAVNASGLLWGTKVGALNWSFRVSRQSGTTDGEGASAPYPASYVLTGIANNRDNTSACNFTESPAVVLLEEYTSAGTAYVDAICVPTDETGTTTVEVSVGTPSFINYTAVQASLVSLTSDTYKQQAVDLFGVFTEYDATDNDKATITYPNDQMYANVYISEVAAAISGSSGGGVVGGELGSVTKWAEDVASINTKNLIVIGGSAVNPVSAKLLGITEGTTGEQDSWATATGVKQDMAIIKLFTSPYATDKVAMLIAGWEAKDTLAAGKVLTKKTIAISGESALLETVTEETVKLHVA